MLLKICDETGGNLMLDNGEKAVYKKLLLSKFSHFNAAPCSNCAFVEAAKEQDSIKLPAASSPSGKG